MGNRGSLGQQNSTPVSDSQSSALSEESSPSLHLEDRVPACSFSHPLTVPRRREEQTGVPTILPFCSAPLAWAQRQGRGVGGTAGGFVEGL